MSDAIFPDNTVLCSFAAVGRLDLIEGFLRGQGRWTEAVAAEVERSSHHVAPLGGVASAGWLGDPIVIDDEDEICSVEHVRRRIFGGTPRKPTQHLGESQTLWVIQHRPNFAGAWWVSDDVDSLEFAREQGITTRETIDIMREIVADGDLTAAQAFTVMQRMHRAARGLRIPDRPRDLE